MPSSIVLVTWISLIRTQSRYVSLPIAQSGGAHEGPELSSVAASSDDT